MPGVSAPEREGTRAVLRHSSTPATKVRQVLDLIRGQDVSLATEILANGDREAATTVGKVLASAVANATHNDGLDPEELYVSVCYADEGTTLKRWRPRARGRATRIRKRTSHITVIVSRMPDERLARHRAKQSAGTSQRSRRVAGSRRRQQAASGAETEAAPTPTTDSGSIEEADAPDAGTDSLEDDDVADLGEGDAGETDGDHEETVEAAVGADDVDASGDDAEEKGE